MVIEAGGEEREHPWGVGVLGMVCGWGKERLGTTPK